MKAIASICCLLFSWVYVQAQSPLDMRLDFSCKDCSYKRIFRALRERHQAPISYRSGILPKGKKVDVQWQDKDLGKGLEELLEGTGLDFKVVREHVVLVKGNEESTASKQDRRVFVLSGRVKENEGEHLTGAVVHLKGTPHGFVTDFNGRFELKNLPPGTYVLRVSFIGYAPEEIPVTIQRNIDLGVVALNPTALELEPTIIESDPIVNRTTMGEAVLSKETIESSKGLVDDPLQALATLPGTSFINQPYFLSPQGMSIRGGHPHETLYLLDNAPLFRPFFYLNKSLFNPAIVDEIEVLTGGFPAAFGHSMSAVVHVKTRSGDLDSFQGQLSKDFFNTNVQLEGPLVKDKLSLIGSLRSSHWGIGPDTVNIWTGIMYDLNLKLLWKISDRHQFTWSALAGMDEFELPVGPLDFRNGETFSQSFQLQSLIGNRWYSKFSLVQSLQHFRPIIDPDQAPFDILFAKGGIREDLSFQANPKLRLRFGLEAITDSNTCDHPQPSMLPACAPVSGQALKFGQYAQGEWRAHKRLTLNAGLRADYYSIYDAFALSPRLALALDLSSHNSLRLSWGRYLQEPNILERAFPTQQKPEAYHYVLGIRRKRQGWNAWLEAYHKDYRYLNSLGPPIPGGEGHATGVEALIQKQKGQWKAWGSYAMSWAARKWRGLEERRPTEYDQRHIFNFGLHWRKSKNQRFPLPNTFNVSMRVHSGRPYTPLLRIDPSNGIPLYGDYHSRRYPWGAGLNARIAWRIPLKKESSWGLGLYIEGWNLLGKGVYLGVENEFDAGSGNALSDRPVPGWGQTFNVGLKIDFGGK